MTKIELIAGMCDCINAAIGDGSWQDVDANSQAYLDMAEAVLEQEGFRRDGINGGEWIVDV